MAVAWIAVDWGTSNLRVWGLDAAGEVLFRRHSDAGVQRLEPDAFEAALLALVGTELPADTLTPVIACGMVGSRQGWVEAGYVSVPCMPSLATQAAVAPVSDPRLRVQVLPGVSQSDPADVMRGEETQIAGYLAAHPDADTILCLPGTHSKWVRVQHGRIQAFRTVPSGELFALLSTQSVLSHVLAAEGRDEDAFAGAVQQAMHHPATLSADLFTIRADSLLHGLSGTAARSRLSGLLLGAELAATAAFRGDQEVVLIGTAALVELYAAALDLAGVTARRVNGDEITLAGLGAAYHRLYGETA